MREMFGAQSVRWSANLLEEKIEINVDSSTAIVDANTLVGVVKEGCFVVAMPAAYAYGCHDNHACVLLGNKLGCHQEINKLCRHVL